MDLSKRSSIFCIGSSSIKNYKKRELYSAIEDYVYGESHDKVFILYGLRRTGKTTLIRQIF